MGINNEANSNVTITQSSKAGKTYKCQICSNEAKGASEAMTHLVGHGSIFLNAMTSLIKEQEVGGSPPAATASASPSAMATDQSGFGVTSPTPPVAAAVAPITTGAPAGVDTAQPAVANAPLASAAKAQQPSAAAVNASSVSAAPKPTGSNAEMIQSLNDMV